MEETGGGIDSAIFILAAIVLVVASAFAFYRLKKRSAKAKAASLQAESGLKASLELVKEQATQRQLSPEEIERRARVAAAWEAEEQLLKPKPYGHFSNISEPLVQPPIMTGAPAMSEPFNQEPFPSSSPFGVQPPAPAAPGNPFDSYPDELAYEAEQAQSPFNNSQPAFNNQPFQTPPAQQPVGLPMQPPAGLPMQPPTGLPMQPAVDAFPMPVAEPIAPPAPVQSETTATGLQIAAMLEELALAVEQLASSPLDDRAKADQITLLIARRWAELPLSKLN